MAKGTVNQKKAAQALFMMYKPLGDIAHQVGVTEMTIRTWAKEWEAVRTEETRGYISAHFEGAARKVSDSIIGVALPMVHNSLIARAQETKDGKFKPLSIVECSIVVGMMDRMQNLFELAMTEGDKNAPTYAPLTLAEIKAVFLEDKFFDRRLLETDVVPIKEIKDVTPKRKRIKRSAKASRSRKRAKGVKSELEIGDTDPLAGA